MKLKLLLFILLLSGGVLNAQNDTIQGLLITEAFLGNQPDAYFEISNLGSSAVNLGVIEWAEMRPWGTAPLGGLQWQPEPTRRFMLPDFILEPGKSFVLATVRDWGPAKFAEGLDGYPEKDTKDEMWTIADMHIHTQEKNTGPGDSIFQPGNEMFNDIAGGRSCMFIRQHINETDSVVLDQVNGWFDGDGSTGTVGLNHNAAYDIAGVTDASSDAWLIRKFKVKQGNLDFASAAGIGADDSEWIVVIKQGSEWRDVLWTVGNHGDYVLDENTLVSSVADVDFTGKTITVPWGTRRGDGIMHLMEKKPGLAWVYHVAPVFEDSLTFAAQTGDQLELIVCGNEGYIGLFDIIVAEPTADANIVVPVSNRDDVGWWRDDNEEGMLGWPRVTQRQSGMDSIWGARGGIPYATRVDTLLERLDKPSNATWEIAWVDGVERVDLKDGDKLKVKAANGSIKEYYIAVLPIRPSHISDLAAITWPDIPDFYKGIFGWVGDTIPNFGQQVYNYRVQVPLDAEGIPGLLAKTIDENAKVQVNRAANLTGTVSDRTITFTVQAEDDTTFSTYNVELVKEKNPINIQPFHAKPFLAEYIFWDLWSNSYAEICNPGNQPLDLSDYMFASMWTEDPATAVTWNSGVDDWNNRYGKYIPGYKFVSEGQWAATPGLVEQDLAVNPIVQPGDVFCVGSIYTDSWTHEPNRAPRVWAPEVQLDVQFHHDYTGSYGYYTNPWNEPVGSDPVRNWSSSHWYMWEILNDSIKLGLKAPNDPNDFELIEYWGMPDGSNWNIGGQNANMRTSWVRKPHIWQGNPNVAESYGTNLEDSEWLRTVPEDYDALGFGWPISMLNVTNDLGKHFMNTVTHYMSTVSSVVYKVSPGFGAEEEIRGMTPGTTAADFLANLIKADERQTLTVTSDGEELAMDALLSMDDVLTVLSADSTNTTVYMLEVAEGGLSANAILTSSRYDIEIISQPKSAGNEDAGVATIKGFEYGTSLKTIVANITAPAGATVDMVDGDGAYVPLKRMNFDTTFVNITVNSNIYFDVTAENGVTNIVYQLVPDVSQNAAFITSDVYSVIQKDVLIQLVPRGTNVQSFLSNLVASAGATIKLVDKIGIERVDGEVADDDKVIVTSPNGLVSTVYYISKLATQYIIQTTYLAYITSNVYNIDQVNNNVTGVSGTVAEFYSKITPSMGATAVVVDASGNERASGNIAGGDMVKVTSADGKIVVMYDLTTVGNDAFNSTEINLYPNPTTGAINVSGVTEGNRIQVFNSMGAAIRDFNVQSSIEVISLDDQPAGMYMIVISDENQMIGRYKALRR